MKNPRIQLAFGIALSLVFLYLALRGVDPADLWMAVKEFNWWWAVPFTALTIFSMWLRAWRWRYFLLPTADLSARRLFSPTMAGFAINGLLPARLGEFARAYILARRENLPFARVFGTIVVERIFDTLILLGLLSYVFMTLEINPEISYPYSTKGEVSRVVLALAILSLGLVLAGVGYAVGRRNNYPERSAVGHRQTISRSFLGAGAVLVLVGPVMLAALPPTVAYGTEYEINGETLKDLSNKVAMLSILLLVGAALLVWPAAVRLFTRIIEKFPLLPTGLRRLAITIMNTFAEGMQSLRSPKLILIVTLQSLAVWLAVAWSMQIMPYGFDGMRAMSMSEATALMVITCLAILIPAAPGYWGLMELGIKFGMVILAIDTNPSRVMAYALIVHALQYFPITGIGLYCLWKSQITMSEIRHQDLPADAQQDAEETAGA